jgi:class 3 adenylate cyclase/tetratricopeptide (TPR) repeat protein
MDSSPLSSISPGIAISTEQTVSDIAEGERKTVTALFADIKGSMELMEDLDPEEARAIVDPALKLMIEAVRRYGGYVVQSTGDGIFALFGAPVAHEDHPQRALYAALRLQEEMHRYSGGLRQVGNLPVEARVGVNTGEVVVRSIATGGNHPEYTPIGHSTSLAARMQALAPTGSIAATDGTRKLCEGYFTFRTLGPARIKGVSEPVEVFEITGLGPLRTRLQVAARRGLTRFVGREREMEALRHAAELAGKGRGQLVAAMGEPGAGKSRLFHEFKLISQSQWMVLEAFSLSHGKATAYLPLLELLREYFRIIPTDDLRTRREKVTGRVLALDRSLEDTLTYLYALLGLSEDDDQLAQMDAQVRRRRTHEAIKRILLRESLNQPLMVIVEDLHWIDGETEALLNLLVDAIANARILLLVNYRPEYHHEWGNRTYYNQLRLDPLGRENAEEMLDALLSLPLARSDTLPLARSSKTTEPALRSASDEWGQGEGADLAALKRLIIERTEGNPFFMEETVQALLDDGALVRNDQVRLTRPLAEVKIPLTVQAMLAARIDRLLPAEKELLQTLAVIGKEPALDLIKAATGKGEEQIEPMLTNLQLGEFIYEQPSFAGPEYTFKHALTQEVAYDSLLTERRRLLHDRAARALEELSGDQLDDHYGELAHHYLRSENVAKATHYAQLAAEQAVNRGAYGEATSLIEAALKLLDKMPRDAECVRAELAIRNIESLVARILNGLASAEYERIVHRMCELGQEIGENKDTSGLLALALLWFARGTPARGLDLVPRILELAEAAGNAQQLAATHMVAGVLANSSGSFGEALRHFAEALRYARQADVRFTRFGLLYSAGVGIGSVISLQLKGHLSEAAKLLDEVLRQSRDSRHMFTLAFALTVGGGIHHYRRQPEIVRVCSEEAIAITTENGFTEWIGQARLYQGWALAELGQLDVGVTEMQAAVAGFRQVLGGTTIWPQYTIALLANGYARMGRVEEALIMLNDALIRIEETGEKGAKAEILRLKGEVLLMGDRSATAEAEKCFRAALEVARAQEAKWWQLRASVSLARLLRDTNRRDEARTILDEIYNWFTEGFDLLDLKEAKALLEELDGTLK